jgi:dihydroflavonol-4-reductase
MTTLLTGATGFVGSAVLRALINKGHQVRVLVRAGADRSNLEGISAEIAEGDLTDPASLEVAARGCSALFHVAADYRLWVPDPPAIYRTNVEGTRALMHAAAAAGVERIVYTSSVATLGSTIDGSPADESTPVSIKDMIGDYKRSKFLAEEEVRRMARDEGLPVVIVNPSTPIGPRDIRPTPTGRMIEKAASGHMPAFMDTGLNVVHVDDVAQGHLLAFEKGKLGERYILGGENLTLEQIFTEVARLTGHSPPRIRLPGGVVLPIAYISEAWAKWTGGREPMATVVGVRLAKKRMFFASAKAEAELGYRHRPASQALEDAVHWFQPGGGHP